MDPEQLKLIEEMLAKGMTEEQILAQLMPTPTHLKPATMSAAPARNPLATWVMRNLLGVVDPLDMTPQEEQGTLPLPFTEKRLEPGTAMLNAATMGAGMTQVPAAVRSLMQSIASRMPAARARGANALLNEMVPGRLTPPNRMLPPHASSGNVTHMTQGPEFPRGVMDDLMQTPDLQPGFTDFINVEAFPETAVMGTKPPVEFIQVAGQAAKRKAGFR